MVLLYMAAQAVMNLYMKHLMSRITVAPGLEGLPASFLVTGLQQLVALCLFLGLVCLAGHRLPGLLPERLNGRQRLLILGLAVAFSLNMGLNNFSLAFIPLSINQVIRACMPLATALLQATASRSTNGVSGPEWVCMVAGVACAVLTVVSRTEGHLLASGGIFFGVILCSVSVLCGAADLVMKQTTGTELKLRSVTAMGLMALPSFLFLLVPGCFWHHPLPDAWAAQLVPSEGSACWTDADVLVEACSLRAGLLGFVALSGVLSFGYNVFTTFFAVRLTATTASFVGNFPTSTLVSLLLLEQRLPQGRWALLLWASILGNVAAFTAYNVARSRRLAQPA